MSSEIITDEFLQEIKKAAENSGLDPELVTKEDLSARRAGNKIHIRWKDVEVEIPAPSQDELNSWFRESGQAIGGALMALAGVALTGTLAIAAAKVLKN